MITFNYQGLTGDIVTRENFNYEESRKAWNRAIEKYPLVIVYCYEKEDIINAMNWAKSNDLEFRIRSGAHHYEGYSTGDGLVVIDISRMNKIDIDEENKRVKIQGGVRNRELYEALGSKGYPFPGGGCPTVGVSGFVLGGGWGYSGRLLGLGCDNLVELELLDYKGDIIIVNESQNSDLFWACRGGGGGNFGIVTSMTFKLFEKVKMGTLVTIDYAHITIDEHIKVVELWQNEFKKLDRRANFKMAVYNSVEKGQGIRITGLFYGTEEEARGVLKEFGNIISSCNMKLEYTTVLEANRSIQDSHPDYEKYKSGGRFVEKDYSKEEIEEIIKLVNSRADGSVYAAISFYGLGGAIADKDKNDTAFYYRDAKFIMGIQSVWKDEKYAEPNIEWVKERYNKSKSITTGAFINFPFADIKDYEKEYYGNNNGKLKVVKAKYDPYNVFNFVQGIKVNK